MNPPFSQRRAGHSLLCPDVLIEIFSYICKDAEVCSPVGTPVVLARVCRLWRAVAIRTQSLWSSFCVSCTEEHEAKDCLIRPFLSLYLSRSRNAPLKISIDLADSRMNDRLLRLIAESSQRWRRLELSRHVAWKLQALVGETRLPMLHYLHLRSPDYRLATFHYLHLFNDAPLLTQLTCDILPWALSLPFHQLQDLRVRNPLGHWVSRRNGPFTALKRVTCTSLTEGEMTIPPTVESFTFLLHWDDGALALRGLGRCTAPPQLRQLRFESARLNEEISIHWTGALHTNTLDMIRQLNSHSLTSLAFRHISFDARTLVRLLHAAPSVDDLEIWEPFSTEVFIANAVAVGLISVLKWRGPSKTLLPGLRRLAIFNSRAIREAALVEMVRSRRSESPLRVLVFCYSAGWLEDATAAALTDLIGYCSVGRDPALTEWWDTVDEEDCRNAFLFRS